jgi:hypothetical protein
MIEMSHTVIDPRTVMVCQERLISKTYAMVIAIYPFLVHIYVTHLSTQRHVLTEGQTCYTACSDGPLGAYISYTFDNDAVPP